MFHEPIPQDSTDGEKETEKDHDVIFLETEIPIHPNFIRNNIFLYSIMIRNTQFDSRVPLLLDHSNVGRLLARYIGSRGVWLRSLKTLLTKIGRLRVLDGSRSLALTAVAV
jgi:hypothetical protein